MTNLYYTVSATGRDEIIDFLNTYHKAGSDQNIEGWIAAAEMNLADFGKDHANIEIRSYDAISGHTEVLVLEGSSLKVNEA